MFSPKVLDRANTIEFRVATEELAAAATKPSNVAAADPLLPLALLSVAQDETWQHHNAPDGVEEYRAWLLRLHALLAQSGHEFGHRTYYEALRFAAVLRATGNASLHDALDFQVLQKILPRIHGPRRRIEPVLIALGQYCYSLDSEVRALSSSGAPFDPLTVDPAAATLPRSFDKLRRMLRSLRANQFVSFTEP